MAGISRVAALIAVVAPLWPQAGATQAMTYEDVVNLRVPSDPRISPDGQQVIFVLRARDEAKDAFNLDLYWVGVREGDMRRLTFHPKRDAFPRWNPDGRSVAFLSDRDGTNQIYVLPMGGGEARRLTKHGAAITSFEWWPDGGAIYFVAPVPKDTTSEQGTHDMPEVVVVDEEQPFAHLWRLNLETETVERISEGDFHVAEAALSPDGTRFALTLRATPKIADILTQELYVLSLRTNQRQRVTDDAYMDMQPRWSPDGRWLASLRESDGNPVAGPSRVHVRAAGGDGPPRVLAPEFDGYVRDFRWSDDGRHLMLVADHRVNRHIYRQPVDGGPMVPVTQGDGLHGSFTVARSNEAVAYLQEDPSHPADVWWRAGPDAQPRRLTQLNPQSESWALGRVETVRWKSADGLDVEGLLVYPLDYQPGRAYPTILEVHGGPEGAYMRGFMAGWVSLPHIYAAAGYFTLMPNFRGSSNYGAAFAQANQGDVGGGDYRDCMTGLDYLIERGLADPARLAIKGWSYGGYMSGWAIGHTDRFRVAAFGAGLSNAVSYYGTADIQFSRENLHGGSPYERQQRWMEMSPLTYVQHASTPSLIFHGEKDARVPLGQSQELYMGLRKHGVPTKLVIYPNQPHGLIVPSYQLDKMKREVEWIDEHLRRADTT